MSHIVRPLVVALAATIGDFIWFEYGVSHTTLHGVLHGALLLLVVGLVLGQAAGAIARGSLGGIAAGVMGAVAFYATFGILGFTGGLMAAWGFMWVVLASINAWLQGRASNVGEWFVRGGVGAVASGAAFYLVSGIWTDHATETNRNYVWHLVAWTIAWAPGLMALTFVPTKR